MDSAHVLVALAVGVVCAALGWFVPALIARIPEPEPEPEPAPDPGPDPGPDPEPSQAEASDADRRLFSSTLPPAPAKERYADIATVPGLGLRASLASGVAGAAIGAAAGWTGALVFLVPLVPVAVALFVVDWRTTLLPSWVIKPAYPVLVVLVLVAAAIDQDLRSLERAGWGWLVLGGWFLVFWVLTGGGGWGYGDVRLSGLLGIALGYLGWAQLVGGLLLIFVCGSVGAVALAVRQRSLRGRLPYGPYMLLGAWLGVLVGPWLGSTAGY